MQDATDSTQLLNMLRDSIRKENPTSADADLKAVDGMWTELERLLEAAQEAKTALPTFLEKQKDNMSLYHTSMVNEAFQETQDELNAQHKKVNLQHTLILEHQQAFQEYKADVEPKIKSLVDLQERVSRLTLERGLLQSELDGRQQELKEMRADRDEGVKKIEEVKKELDRLVCDAH
jgi:chromosome segregation ATPase